ncbi:MAG TPA: DUF423 domain-containing protein, partial [Lacunisphaera sp.]|nr:DUF423 domain-containing protein [Lacunisphaera sp.]
MPPLLMPAGPQRAGLFFFAEVRTVRRLMKSKIPILLIAASLLGFTGVALGAFGAHGFKNTLEASGQLKNWEKAVFYQLIHAVALLAIANRPLRGARAIGWCWLAGVGCFSGSLYWIALGGPTALLWPVTPLGG